MRRVNPGPQLSLPGVSAGQGRQRGGADPKIPHRRILAGIETDATRSGIIEIYRREVLPVKTRTLQLVGQKSTARILNTLLGYEVKARFKRIQCPDLVTARYVKLFSELGCRTIKLPYDPTVTARIVPELEGALSRVDDAIRRLFPNERALRLYVTRRVFAHLRRDLRRRAP